MSQLNLVFAFTAGMLATVNPCAWAMLPSFLAYYLGSREEGYELEPLSKRAREGIFLGLLITAGFLVVFGGMAIVISAGLRVIIKFMPLLAIAVGLSLVILGLWLLRGRSLPFYFPQPNLDVRARNPRSVFMYGLAYGFASLSCTLPIFLAVVVASLTTSGASGMALMFGSYALGMAVVLMSVALGAALFKGIVAQWFRKLLPYMNTVGALLLIIAGIYLVWFQARYLPFILATF